MLISRSCQAGIHSLRIKVDTGAEGNTLPLWIYRQMYTQNVDSSGLLLPDRVQEKPQTVLMAYNGSQIRQFCILMVPYKKGNTQWVDTEFFIVKAAVPTILGLPTWRDLQLLTLHCSLKENCATDKPVNTVDDLLATDPYQFDNIGNFPSQYRIVVNPRVPLYYMHHVDVRSR